MSSISGAASLTTSEMQTIEGKLTFAASGMKGITSLTIKDNDGTKHKFKSAEVNALRVKIDGLAKLEMIAEKTKNLDRLFSADFSEIVDRKYAYYEQVKVPEKDKYVLTQLLNPGFAKKIKVFDKPGAKTADKSVNGVAISGSKAKAYYVIKEGITYEISKSKYRKSQFKMLYGNCPDMIRFYADPDFDQFAEHVLYYELNCR